MARRRRRKDLVSLYVGQTPFRGILSIPSSLGLIRVKKNVRRPSDLRMLPLRTHVRFHCFP